MPRGVARGEAINKLATDAVATLWPETWVAVLHRPHESLRAHHVQSHDQPAGVGFLWFLWYDVLGKWGTGVSVPYFVQAELGSRSKLSWGFTQKVSWALVLFFSGMLAEWFNTNHCLAFNTTKEARADPQRAGARTKNPGGWVLFCSLFPMEQNNTESDGIINRKIVPRKLETIHFEAPNNSD